MFNGHSIVEIFLDHVYGVLGEEEGVGEVVWVD